MAVALIFSALTQTLTGALQGIGKVFVPAISILAGCICKIILNLLLVRIPAINIYGAAISSIVCQFVAFLVNFTVLTKHIPLKITLIKYVIKPLIAAVVMGCAAAAVYGMCSAAFGGGYINNLVSTLISLGVSAIIYVALIIVLRVMNKDDIQLLPGGTRLYSILVKLKLYK